MIILVAFIMKRILKIIIMINAKNQFDKIILCKIINQILNNKLHDISIYNYILYIFINYFSSFELSSLSSLSSSFSFPFSSSGFNASPGKILLHSTKNS